MKKQIKTIEIRKDILDQSGRIYIKKGSFFKLDQHNKERLEKLGLLDEVLVLLEEQESTMQKDSLEGVSVENKRSSQEILDTIKDKFLNLYGSIDFEKFQVVAEKVQKIIDNARQEMWYIHLNTLANYAEWYYSHSINTALISGMIGIRLGYKGKKLDQLIIGALMHDIGMILIPKEILYKEIELDEEEIEIQKKHCELGEAMVLALDLATESKAIIKQHHERMDGTGYPLGLKGNEITEGAQIVMIADSFDAGTSPRPYRAARSSEEVGREILFSEGKYSRRILESIKEIMGVS